MPRIMLCQECREESGYWLSFSYRRVSVADDSQMAVRWQFRQWSGKDRTVKSNQIGDGQIVLFNGITVPDTFKDGLVVNRVQKPEQLRVHTKGKNKGKPLLGKSGKQLKQGSQDFTIVRVLPRETTAKDDAGNDKPSIQSLHVDWDGQTVMGFEMKLRQEVCKQVLNNLHSRMMNGEITFGQARCNNKNGNISVAFRRSGGFVVAGITREQALKALSLTDEQYDRFMSVEKPAELGQ